MLVNIVILSAFQMSLNGQQNWPDDDEVSHASADYQLCLSFVFHPNDPRVHFPITCNLHMTRSKYIRCLLYDLHSTTKAPNKTASTQIIWWVMSVYHHCWRCRSSSSPCDMLKSIHFFMMCEHYTLYPHVTHNREHMRNHPLHRVERNAYIYENVITTILHVGLRMSVFLVTANDEGVDVTQYICVKKTSQPSAHWIDKDGEDVARWCSQETYVMVHSCRVIVYDMRARIVLSFLGNRVEMYANDAHEPAIRPST